MIGDFLRLAVGEASTHVRGWVAAAVLGLLTAAFIAVAIGFGTAAAYTALSPELGAAWTAALIGAIYLALGLVASIYKSRTAPDHGVRRGFSAPC